MVVYVVATTVSPTYVQRGLCSLTALHYAFSLVEGRGVCASVCACAFVCSRTGISWLPLQCLIARCTYVCAFGTCALLHTPVERVPMLHTHTHTHTHTLHVHRSVGKDPSPPTSPSCMAFATALMLTYGTLRTIPSCPCPTARTTASRCVHACTCVFVCIVCIFCR